MIRTPGVGTTASAGGVALAAGASSGALLSDFEQPANRLAASRAEEMNWTFMATPTLATVVRHANDKVRLRAALMPRALIFNSIFPRLACPRGAREAGDGFIA